MEKRTKVRRELRGEVATEETSGEASPNYRAIPSLNESASRWYQPRVNHPRQNRENGLLVQTAVTKAPEVGPTRGWNPITNPHTLPANLRNGIDSRGRSGSSVGMKPLGLGVTATFFLLCHSLLEDEVCPRKPHALAIALLPLHRGSNCRVLVQKGVQQKVALETALEAINSRNELQIGMKVLDTCSSREKAAESAAKGMLLAEKRCAKFPVFLGFLGPDDEESIRRIAQVNAEYSHVVPAAVSNFHQYNTINVETIDSEETARRIGAFLRYLHWYSFILIFTSDGLSTRIATSLLESNHFCLSNSVLRLPSFGSDSVDRRAINRLRRVVEEVENVRIVVITDDPEVMGHFTDFADEEWGQFQYVVYVKGSGILPWRSPKRMLQSTVILHEAPKSPLTLPNFDETLVNSTLWNSYAGQAGRAACDGCKYEELLLDPTVVPYVYALHLLSQALKTATRTKCRGTLICEALKAMKPFEWKAILEEAVTVVDTRKLRFYMKLDSSIDVIAYGEDHLSIVGSVTDGVSIFRPDALKRPNRSRVKQCLVDMYEYELEPDPVDDVSSPEVQTTETAEEEEEKKKIPLNFGYYELMATVIGFPIGLVLFIAATVACVYRSYRSESGKTQLSADTGVEDFS